MEREERLLQRRMNVEPYFDKLAAMQSVEEIRKFFTAEGVKAIPCSGNFCAIAQYIKDGSGETVWVNSSSVSILDYGYEPDVFINTIPMMRFVYAFDHGDFPELLEEA